MADEEKTGKKFPMVLIVALIVTGLILAGGISYFIAMKVIADKAAAPPVKTAHDPGVFIKLGDPKEGLVLNIGGINSGRFLKVGLIVELKPDKKSTAAGGKGPSPEETKILDTVVYVLRSQKMEDFDPSRQEQLKEVLKNEIGKVIGEDRVLDIYITNFVLQ
ncbi:MAG TPA: flagellar basal body-associated FliL family protein [Patescibacteria group bacterium]|nr:flagellar basal body-associated FliL family protein [Patescibacteria group bacterium]